MRTLPTFALAIALLAACEPAEVVDEPTEDTAEAEAEADDAEDAEDDPERITASVGDTITLAGSDDALQVEVTLVDIHNPATGSSDFDEVEEGHRFVAADLRLTVTGNAPYDDSPSNSGELIDTDDAGRNPTLAEVDECDSFGGAATIPAGDTRTGCLVFEVPDGREARSFQFSLDSGFAPQTGVWEL